MACRIAAGTADPLEPYPAHHVTLMALSSCRCGVHVLP
jgi:hypothetical protein